MMGFIEQWRIKVIGEETKMIICAHSLGCYISYRYTLQYGRNVEALSLIDPWGIYSRKLDSSYKQIPTMTFRAITAVAETISPMAIARKSNLIGTKLFKIVKKELYMHWVDVMDIDT